MTQPIFRAGACTALLLAGAATCLADPAPSFDASGELARPADYREWIYLTTGLDMFYGPIAAAMRRDGGSVFSNVYVTPDAYREFMRSGIWPEKTMFILEARRAETAASIDNVGKSQGPLLAIESAVKDTARFGKNDGSNGWGYFVFGGAEGFKASASALPTSAACYSCHAQNTAVDNTFVQYYPTLFEVAKRLGTVKPTYDPAHKL
jgi:hypothetical protein